jgi:hypothetical protein
MDPIADREDSYMQKMQLDNALSLILKDVEALVANNPVVIDEAQPPNDHGVYMLLVDGVVMYVGEAKGSKGLRDRILAKHVSGDDNHAIQRAFREEFPDRGLRRDHIKKTVFARWLNIAEPARISAVERVLIWLYEPVWNLT